MSGLSDYLTSLGFIVRAGKRGCHKVFTHSKLAKIGLGSFNCGHGGNPEIKPVNVVKIIKELEEYAENLDAFVKKGESR